MNILVIDVGTSSMRGILFTQDGETLTQRQQLYQVTYGEKGWVWQDASDWENALYGILREITAETEEKGWRVDAIAITSQRSSVIPVDREFKPLCPAIMWQDKRTGESGIFCQQDDLDPPGTARGIQQNKDIYGNSGLSHILYDR